MDGEVDLIEFEQGSSDHVQNSSRESSRSLEPDCHPTQRRLLLTEWDEAWSRIKPEKIKSDSKLRSLGDDAVLLDAILVHMIPEYSPSTPAAPEEILPSAPPMEWDDTWDGAGPSASLETAIYDDDLLSLHKLDQYLETLDENDIMDDHIEIRSMSASPTQFNDAASTGSHESTDTIPQDPVTPRRKESVRQAGSTEGSEDTNSDRDVIDVVVLDPIVAAGPSSAPQPSSATSQWLRQSMRRLTHFRLADPPVVTNPEPRPPSPIETPSEECDMAGEALSPLGQWPHGLSSMLACLACTLGIFNISRFAILSVQFGANFILQFFIMSFILGIPLFTFHVSIGQLLGSGVMDMWKISPIFQGIGIALIISQALLGIYSIVGVSWMLVYFRDSFITKQDTYRWAESYPGSIGGPSWRYNSTLKLEETVPDYFSGTVLQRNNLDSPANSPGHLKFQVTFNLAVVWMIVFISLSKGLKSYGKVVFLFSLVPAFGMLVLCTKMLGLTPNNHKLQMAFPQTDWSEFFLNSKSWSAAMSEAFYTWGLLGASAMQMASHNRPKHILHRDTTFVTTITFSVLILSAFLANTCSQVLLANNYLYVPSSFEKMSTYSFLQNSQTPIRSLYYDTPVRWMSHQQFVLGEKILKPGLNPRQQSGYQALRLLTELVPSTFAIIGAERLSPFWSVLFYFIMILFGIAQQLAIMHCVITGIMAIKVKTMQQWETTITFFTCTCGFILGLPMATELGIFVVYFMDFCVGGAWWIMLLYLIELIAVFMVRGRPYSGETVVTTLFAKARPLLQNWAAPLLCFTWSVILPVLLMVLCIAVFKIGNYRDLYRWSAPMLYDYWPSWSRQVGATIQLLPLLTIPFIGIVQTFRYLSSGPPDIFDRILLLYRPPEEAVNALTEQEIAPMPETESNPTSVTIATIEDPPPKYTPPPSYTTATGARIAKLLRQSFRRSVRRITNALGTSEANTSRQEPPPPDYAAVLVEINQALSSTSTSSEATTSTLTVNEVANILRSSFRRVMRDGTTGSTSSERLVETVTPICRDSIIPNENDSKCAN